MKGDNKMSLKTSIENLSKKLGISIQELPYIVNVLKDGLADMADNAEDSSTVIVTPVVTEGTKIATITVNGDDNDLYTPNITPLHIYDEDEHLVGRWFHDDIDEDVYEKTFSLANISTAAATPDELIPASYVLLDVKPVGIYTVSGEPYVFDDLIFVNSVNNDIYNLRLVLKKGSEYYTIIKEGSGTISNAYLTLRYVKRT